MDEERSAEARARIIYPQLDKKFYTKEDIALIISVDVWFLEKLKDAKIISSKDRRRGSPRGLTEHDHRAIGMAVKAASIMDEENAWEKEKQDWQSLGKKVRADMDIFVKGTKSFDEISARIKPLEPEHRQPISDNIQEP
ncbi:MAG TPA: hypothetical protein ENI23_06325 [bacterium]|nr:hypothetical protein [bacterium]